VPVRSFAVTITVELTAGGGAAAGAWARSWVAGCRATVIAKRTIAATGRNSFFLTEERLRAKDPEIMVTSFSPEKYLALET
jgi:hypothetical protein